MGWSDARDSRDRPEGHGTTGGGSGAGGRSASVTGNRFGAPSASAQAAAMARNAPTNAPYGGQGGLNARRSMNPTPSYEMSLHNMMELAKNAIPGPGLVMGAGKMVAGYGPDFTGYQGQVNGPGDYDPKDRPMGLMSMGGAPSGFNGAYTPQAFQAMLAQAAQARTPQTKAMDINRPPADRMRSLMDMPGMYQGVNAPGLAEYGVWRPPHSY